jgi:hypothetical protein
VIGRILHVKLDGMCVDAFCLEFASSLFTLGLRTSAEDYGDALFAELLGGFEPDAAVAASDERNDISHDDALLMDSLEE